MDNKHEENRCNEGTEDDVKGEGRYGWREKVMFVQQVVEYIIICVLVCVYVRSRYEVLSLCIM